MERAQAGYFYTWESPPGKPRAVMLIKSCAELGLFRPMGLDGEQEGSGCSAGKKCAAVF